MARVYVCLDDIVLLKQVMDMSMEEQDLKIVGITTSIPQSAIELIEQDADIFIMRYAIEKQKAKTATKPGLKFIFTLGASFSSLTSTNPTAPNMAPLKPCKMVSQWGTA